MSGGNELDTDIWSPCDEEFARAVVSVVSVEGDKVFVESTGAGACRSCSSATGCGTKSLMAVFGKRSVPLSVDNTLDVSVGDQIEIGIEHATILKLSALSYLMPLIGLVGGGSIGAAANSSDILSFVLAVIGLVAGFAYSRFLYSTERWERAVSPICLRRVSSGAEYYVSTTKIS